MREYYEKVSVPQAPEEPDERVDRMTGLPYDMQAGGAFVDEEDRMGFSAAGLVTLIKRLTRSADDVVDDIRPTTRVDIDDDTRNTLLEFRSNEPENFVDPEDVQYSSRRVSADNDGNRIEYRQPNETYFITKQEVNDRLSKEFDDEINNIPEEDIDIVQEYFTSIPKASGTPPPAASVTKQEFLKDSVEQKPQYNGSFFSTEKYDNPLSVRLPRELGLHVGTKGQAETILMRGAYPFSEDMVERVAARMYMDRGMTEQAARVAVSQDGVPDEVLDFIMPELMQSVPTGVTPSLREGFINVKNPLVLDTDMINWNPAKFLGGYDPDNTMRLSDQAQSFVDALEAQVKIAPEQFKSIVDTAATQIDSVLRKKDLNAGKLLNAAYDHRINTITRRMLEDLGFDSIQYKNLGELARVSEKQAGGNSYILFKDDQFVTEFAEDAPYIRQPRTLRETIPEVQKAYDDLKAGVITSDEYDKIVNNTVYPYANVPLPETDEAIQNALTSKQREKINAIFEEGQRVGLRLDINSYLNYDTWVPTIHVQGKAKGHQATAAIKNVDFSMTGEGQIGKLTGAERAQQIMEGTANKSPFAQIMGDYVDRTTDQNFRLAQEALNSDEWIQVGFDPRRHSFFYDRATGQPVATAEEVIQVGPLVLAKKATYADRSLYPYATGGRVLGRLRGRAA